MRIHSGLNFRLEGLEGRASLRLRAKSICAGLSPVSRSGVFLYCKRAATRESVLSDPDLPVLLEINRLMVLTAVSALKLEWGL